MRSTGEDRELVVTYVHIPPATAVVHTLDVTEQRRMEAELDESNETARGIMEGNPDGICLIVGGRISACNDSLAALMGCSTDELVGHKLHELMVPDDGERASERGRQILEGARSEPSEYTLRLCDDSLLPVEIYSAAFTFRGEPALICTLRDISTRKAAERELADSRDALRALTQHLEEVRERERLQVARDLHDELGSVLTALKMDLQDLLDRCEGKGETERLTTMSDLVDQAIEVGRSVTARLRPGILDDLGLAAAAEWLGDDLEKRTGIRCSVVLPDAEPEVEEPVATAMFRILQEALTNVLRHAEADAVEIVLDTDDESVSLTVADTGRGFDPSSVEGGAFGLLGMRERVRAFDGVFDVQSRLGGGTRVRVALPRRATAHRRDS
jgi:PAS domain S-box-containing protein